MYGGFRYSFVFASLPIRQAFSSLPLPERLVVSLGRLRSEKKLAAKAMNTQAVRQEATGHSFSLARVRRILIGGLITIRSETTFNPFRTAVPYVGTNHSNFK